MKASDILKTDAEMTRDKIVREARFNRALRRHETRKFNADDWTGDELSIEYTVETDPVNGGELLRFEYYGYVFSVTGFEPVYKGEGFRSLRGSDWAEPLTTLYLDNDDRESAVIAAMRYVRNYV